MDDAAYEALMARLNEAYPSQPAYTPADVKLQSGQITQQQGQDPIILTNPRTLQQGESNPIEFDQSGGVSQLGAMMNAGRLRGMLDMSAQDGMTPGYNAMGTMQLPEGYSASYHRSNEIGGLGDAQNAIMLAKQFGEPNTPSPSLSAGASRSGMSGPITYDLSGSVPLTTGRNPEAPQFRLPSSREEQPMVPLSRRDLERQPSHQEVRGAATAGLSYSPRDHSTRANAGLKFNYADGGHVDAALHLLRQHFDEGGFLSSLSNLFSGPDYLSTGEVASPTNWGDPESATDFFKADKARMAAERAPDAVAPLPPRRPVAEAEPRPQIAAAPPAPAQIPFDAPKTGMAMPEAPQMASFASQPLAYTAAPAPAPAQAAIAAAMPAGDKLTDRAAAQPGMTDLTPQQADYIIRTIAAESSGHPEESQGIANVIMNRINSGRFGATPEHVLFSKNQFEPWSSKALANYPMKIKPGSDRYQAAAAALDAALQGDDNTGGATFFWGPGSQYALGRNTPKWAREMPDYSDIGATRFHRETREAGGEVEGYGGGGDVVKKALDALRGGTKVFPKPQRMFPEAARPPGGEYLNAATGEAMTGQKPARAVIGVTPEGKPIFLADTEQVDVTGSPGTGSTKTKTNLFKQQAGWKWNEAPEGYENVPTIVSAENRGQHYYGLGADFPNGVDLERYANAASEPRLRPTTQGNVYPGEQVGSIDVRGREHPVYDMLTIRNLLAGTGAGAAGAAAMPEDIQHEAHGGLVDDALHVVREHHADGEAVGPTMQQRLRETIASIDPERSQDQPVMDPATMGEAWNRARQNYQNFPVQEGEAVARQFVPSVRQEIGAAIAGEGAGRDYGSELRNRAAQFAVGSSGLDTGVGALDFVPGTSQALGATDIAHDIGQGDYAGAAEGVALPAAMTATQKFAGPIGRGLSYAGEKIAEHARPIAGVAGTAAALSPEDAEAANVLKALKIAKVAVPDFAPRKMTLQEVRRTFDPHAGAGMSGEELDRLANAYGKVASPASLDPELARRGEEIAKSYITKGGSESGGRSFFRHNPSVPLEELGRATANIPVSSELKPIVNKTWGQVAQERAGSPLLTLGGDLSDWNRILGYGPQGNLNALAWPTDIHAGFDYMREPNPYTVWANNPEHAAILNKQVQQQKDIMQAVKKDLPVMATAAPMGPQSIDSSKNMMDLVLSAIEGKGIHPTHLEDVSDYLRSGEFGKTPKAKAAYKEQMKDFPGFNDPEGARQFLLDNPNIPGTIRGDIVKGLEKATLVKKGFPEIGQLRYAASSPQFAMAPANMMGGRMIEIDPRLFGMAQKDKMFNHLTYPGDTFGRYYADVPLIHRQYGAPDVMDTLMAKYNQWRPGAKKSDPWKAPITVHPFSTDQGGRDTVRKMFEEQRMVQPINPRMLESIQRGEQRRPMYGFNKGGSIVDRALMLVSR